MFQLYSSLSWGLFKRKTNNIEGNGISLEACAKEMKLNKPKTLRTVLLLLNEDCV